MKKLLIFLISLALTVGASIAAESLSVRDFGAAGDGTTDDTVAFQKALDACSKALGGVVSVPTGNYLIKGHLRVPSFVTLEGVFRADRKSTRLNSSHLRLSRMPSSA